MSDTVLGSKCSLCNGTGRVYHIKANYYGRTRTEIVPAQNFAPSDWNLLEATQESLREHMALLKAAEAKVARVEAVIDKGEYANDTFTVCQICAALQEPEHE